MAKSTLRGNWCLKQAVDLQNKIMLCFGDLSKSTAFGGRNDIAIRVLTERYADYYQIGVLGISRFHCMNHSLGSATVAGPMIALKGN